MYLLAVSVSSLAQHYNARCLLSVHPGNTHCCTVRPDKICKVIITEEEKTEKKIKQNNEQKAYMRICTSNRAFFRSAIFGFKANPTYDNLPTFHGYLFRISQHFAMELGSSTDRLYFQ
jgi:hypothetical protein